MASRRDDICRKMGPPLTYKISDAFGFGEVLDFLLCDPEAG